MPRSPKWYLHYKFISKILYVFCMSSMFATCSSHVLYLVILIIHGEADKLCRSWFRNFFPLSCCFPPPKPKVWRVGPLPEMLPSVRYRSNQGVKLWASWSVKYWYLAWEKDGWWNFGAWINFPLFPLSPLSEIQMNATIYHCKRMRMKYEVIQTSNGLFFSIT